MNNPLDSTAFVLIWIGFPLLAGSVAALFFFWGMRNGQFADQERARYLPLESGCLEAEETPPASEAPRHQRKEVEVPPSLQSGRHKKGGNSEKGAGGARPC